MNINAESHFAFNPEVEIKRSQFDRSWQHKTTFNAGELIPIYTEEVLPGDTFQVSTNLAIRMSTPIHPVMDNAYLDLYYFFVPSRLTWDHWKEFMGENNTTAWEQEVEYEIPQLIAPSPAGWQKGTIASYMGIPINIPNISISVLPIRAYVLIWNDWFRDQNIQDPAFINKDETTRTGHNLDGIYQTTAQLGGRPLPVNKYHDYFTSALPEPQKGPDVLIPFGENAPVYGTGLALGLTNGTNYGGLSEGSSNQIGTNVFSGNYGVEVGKTSSGSNNMGASKAVGVTPEADKSGLAVDLTNAPATMNELRTAFQLQKLYERDARGGTRYTEVIKSHFGVTSPDQRQQRPEYLGGKRIPINMDQVLQTSATNEISPQGNTAAFSLTNAQDTAGFTKSFTEHGYIIGLAAIRTEHTYQQGIERMWSRKRRFDYYWPALANIGEQAILNKEIFAQGNAEDDEAFGYQEAWAEYRYKPSRTSGAFSSSYEKTLDVWHYGDEWVQLPTLSDDFIKETKNNIDRTLAVNSTKEDQFLCDFYFNCTATRPMPIYSIPGLVDHN